MILWYRRTWASPAEQSDRVEWHLENWARAHRAFKAVPQGRGGASWASDFEDLVNKADFRCAQAMDAIVEALEQAQERALHAQYLGLKVKLEGQEDALQAAREGVADGLNKRGIW